MFGKIFSQMYEGTLASKGPWEALVTFQQFIVLANRHGEVDKTADAISRITTIPLPIIEKGIEALSAPDPGSRTPACEGRRIVLIDSHRNWGWRIVNYDKYRKIRSEEERREYQRVLMSQRRKKLASVSEVSPCSMQYADVEVKNPSPTKTTLGSIEFQTFWDSYPRKVAKLDALKAWVKGACDGKLGEILAGLESWKRTEQWGDVEKIPYPATFLNGRRWQETPQKGVTKNEQKGERTKRAIERVRAELAGEAG